MNKLKRTCGIFLVDKSNKFLVVHSTGFNKTLWGIPKGLVDIGEDYVSAAYRKFCEETSVDILEVCKDNMIFCNLDVFPYYSKLKNLHAFYLKTDLDLSYLKFRCDSFFMKDGISTPEVDDYKWIDYNEGMKVLNAPQRHALELLSRRTKICKGNI